MTSQFLLIPVKYTLFMPRFPGADSSDRPQPNLRSEDEVIATVEQSEQIPAKFGRSGFRRNFVFNRKWRGEYYRNKQVEVYAVKDLIG